MPVVRAYDASTGTWNSSVEGPESLPIKVTSPVTFAAGPGDAPPTSADCSVAGDVLAGRLLLRVRVARSADATRRVLAVTTVPVVRDVLTELGPEASFAPYDGRDVETYLVHNHAGGPLYISQLDDGRGAAIEAVDVYRIRPAAGRGATAGPPAHRLAAVFAVGAARLSRGARDGRFGELVVEGDASAGGYQCGARLCRSCRVTGWWWPPIEEPARQGVSRRVERQRDEVARAARRSRPGAGVYRRRYGGVHRRRRELQRRHAGASKPIHSVARRVHGHAIRSLRRHADGAGKDGPGQRRCRGHASVCVPAGAADHGRIHGVEAVPPGTEFVFQADIARPRSRGWALRGTPAGQFSYLLASKPQTLTDGRLLLATGWVYRGGITVGLLKEASGRRRRM